MLEAHHGQNSPAELPLRSLSSMTLMPLVSMAPRLAGACAGSACGSVSVRHVLKPSSTSQRAVTSGSAHSRVAASLPASASITRGRPGPHDLPLTAPPLEPQQVVRFADDLVMYLDDERWQGALKHSGIIVPVRHAETVFDLTEDEVAATFRMLAQAKDWLDGVRTRARRLQRRLELRRRRRPAGLPRPPARDPPLRPGTPRRPGHPRPPQGRRQPLVSPYPDRWLRCGGAPATSLETPPPSGDQRGLTPIGGWPTGEGRPYAGER